MLCKAHGAASSHTLNTATAWLARGTLPEQGSQWVVP